MALWRHHRQRQAGKYARASYRLERRRLELEQQRYEAAVRRIELVRRTSLPPALPAVPPRPDRTQ